MKKYKLIKEDEHMFHIQHPDGSTFPIAKNAVGPGVIKKIKGLDPAKMSDGGEVQDGSSDYEQTTTDTPDPTPLDVSPASDQEVRDTATYRSPQSSPEMSVPSPQEAPNLFQNDATSQGFALKESAINQAASAQAAAAKSQAEAYQNQIDQMAATQAHYEQEHAKLDMEHKQLFDGIMNSNIDPNRLFHKSGALSKLGAGVGMVLSGIGSALAGQPNLAMEAINKNLDRDLDAQKADLGKKETLFSENARRFGNLNTAEQMTRLQLNAVTQAKIAQAAATSGSAQAQANAKMALGDLQIQAGQIKQNLTVRRMAAQGGNYDPSTLVPFLVPKEHQAKAFDEIKNAQDINNLKPKIMAAFEMGSSRNPVLAAQGQREFEGLINTTVKETEGTARQAAFDSIHKTMTPSGITASPGENATKARTVMEYLTSKSAAPTAKGYGIDLEKFGNTTTQQPQIKIVNGIKYMRGPNGEAIPVK